MNIAGASPDSREAPDTPPGQEQESDPLVVALDAAFTAELTLRFHNYVEAIPAIGEAAAFEHFMQRWADVKRAYERLLGLIRAERASG